MSAVGKRNIAKIETTYSRKLEKAEISANRRRKLLIRRLTVFFIFAAAVSFVMISTLVSQASILEEKQKEKRALEEKLSDLKKRQNVLQEEIVKLNDDDYIAKLARRDYFLSENNEIIFNLPKEKKEKTSVK
ncbi:FtsB family cell division protein [Bacillus methanolicus]|uniref:Cell division protein DivIC n=1 Tax=Bacillus methanolicus (strain MGA3 / ATCC 53907) TaxID=796606 RepID=I3EC46_BACMM|nr:septum formation initiator family protein [Bacillus methanolicus]AIE58589.1 cell division protein DivIC [Bacillus methanolicus MGA3]EIJ84067.1 cell division protein DivIC [Bacillus methanolicus MGA3]